MLFPLKLLPPSLELGSSGYHGHSLTDSLGSEAILDIFFDTPEPYCAIKRLASKSSRGEPPQRLNFVCLIVVGNVPTQTQLLEMQRRW